MFPMMGGQSAARHNPSISIPFPLLRQAECFFFSHPGACTTFSFRIEELKFSGSKIVYFKMPGYWRSRAPKRGWMCR